MSAAALPAAGAARPRRADLAPDPGLCTGGYKIRKGTHLKVGPCLHGPVLYSLPAALPFGSLSAALWLPLVQKPPHPKVLLGSCSWPVAALKLHSARQASFFAVQRDPTLWAEPDSFKPTRWLADSPDYAGSALKEAWFAFGGGQRGCPGARTARPHLSRCRVSQMFGRRV